MEPHLQRHPLTTARADGPCTAARAEATLGLYVHVPFCARRCHYCDFSTGALSAAAVDRYLAAIQLEAERRASEVQAWTFGTVFFGGGTPSALSARHFAALWRIVRERFRIAPDAEITLEANPESVRAPLLQAWREAGVNRLSMGAQSFVPEELERLGRIHDADRPAAAFALARAHGFERLSLDLMYGFPGHTGERWRTTLDRALALEPEHLSAYCFIPEPGTPLGDDLARGGLTLPEPEEQADRFDELVARLARSGHAPYETSNFCRPGAEARHNLVYWLRRPYVALGPSAHGFVNGVRYGNRYTLHDWARALEDGCGPEAEIETETAHSAAREIVLLGLRLASGVRAADHDAGAWSAVVAWYGGAFERACATGRLERRGDAWRIAPENRFVADDVVAWIEAESERDVARGRVDSSAAAFIPSTPCLSLHSPAA